MKRKTGFAVILAALAMATGAWGQAASVSEKRDMAVFSLGNFGWTLPLEATGAIDAGIQGVFAELGRFNIIEMTQRLSSGGLAEFVQAIRKAKEANFALPEKHLFGEATFTEADFNRLLGAFTVAAPVITLFDSRYDLDRKSSVTCITTEVSFLDVASGEVLGAALVRTTGSDATDQVASMRQVIEAIPKSLEFQVRSMPAFRISTRILAVPRGEVKLQLGSNMGIAKGDEYAVTGTKLISGIKDVGVEISTGVVLYADKALEPGNQLREVPRLGIDVEPGAEYWFALGNLASYGGVGIGAGLALKL